MSEREEETPGVDRDAMKQFREYRNDRSFRVLKHVLILEITENVRFTRVRAKSRSSRS